MISELQAVKEILIEEFDENSIPFGQAYVMWKVSHLVDMYNRTGKYSQSWSKDFSRFMPRRKKRVFTSSDGIDTFIAYNWRGDYSHYCRKNTAVINGWK